jgi:hypothetical protein
MHADSPLASPGEVRDMQSPFISGNTWMMRPCLASLLHTKCCTVGKTAAQKSLALAVLA